MKIPEPLAEQFGDCEFYLDGLFSPSGD